MSQPSDNCNQKSCSKKGKYVVWTVRGKKWKGRRLKWIVIHGEVDDEYAFKTNNQGNSGGGSPQKFRKYPLGNGTYLYLWDNNITESMAKHVGEMQQIPPEEILTDLQNIELRPLTEELRMAIKERLEAKKYDEICWNVINACI